MKLSQTGQKRRYEFSRCNKKTIKSDLFHVPVWWNEEQWDPIHSEGWKSDLYGLRQGWSHFQTAAVQQVTGLHSEWCCFRFNADGESWKLSDAQDRSGQFLRRGSHVQWWYAVCYRNHRREGNKYHLFHYKSNKFYQMYLHLFYSVYLVLNNLSK